MTTFTKVSAQIGGREVSLETGRMAKQANGAVLIQCGGTVVFAAAVAGADSKQVRDFFPLTVDYREKTYAAGRIPGGFFKREGRPSEKEILTSRLIDRPIRPLFPEDYLNEVQISVMVLSVDGENMTEVFAMNAASAALMISDIPYTTPLGAARVGLIDGQFVVNPTHQELEKSALDLVVAGTMEKIVMIEAGAQEISEEQMLEALKVGHEAIKQAVQLQLDFVKKAGKAKKEVKAIAFPDGMEEKIAGAIGGEFEKLFSQGGKEAQEVFLKGLYEKALSQFDTKAEGFDEALVKIAFARLEHEKIRDIVLSTGKRPDGRGERDIRSITCEIDILPRTHGSSLFTRGQTQSLSVATLGTGDDEQTIDALEKEYSKRFMLHYNFPHYSVGEVGPNRGTGRREVGHGALAERALLPILPSKEDFPYTIRLVSEVMESNGSSSMATVCAGTLALMDAGIPIKAPVAGIAIGLVTDDKNRWKVLTDIAGIEDHLGDMDFKAAGTREGLTALQMDMKIAGITEEQLKEAFDHARAARSRILDLIGDCIKSPKDLSQYAPRITTLRIDPEKIGLLIGPGGKNIRKIVEETGAKIDIEDDGRVFVAAVSKDSSDAAIARVQACTEEAEVGKIYDSTVQKLMPFGAFCEVLPGKDGLCHVSEITEGFVKSAGDYLRVGDKIKVKVISIDERGKISLSIKQAMTEPLPILPEDQRTVIEPLPPKRDDRGGRGRRR